MKKEFQSFESFLSSEFDWEISFDEDIDFIKVNPVSRKIFVYSGLDTTNPKVQNILLSLAIGSRPDRVCLKGNTSNRSTKEILGKVVYDFPEGFGPEYWSNSCNVDSIIAFIAFSSGDHWRTLMENYGLHVSGIERKEEVSSFLEGIHRSKGKCVNIRNLLLRDKPSLKTSPNPNGWEMRAVGEIYDLMSGFFPRLKIPILDSKSKITYLYSSIPLETYLGDPEFEDPNFNILVFENNFGFRNPTSFQKEVPGPKHRLLAEKIFDEKYELCGIIYLSGVSISGDTLEDIMGTSSLGTHYTSLIRIPVSYEFSKDTKGKPIVKSKSRWVYYDDLNRKVQRVEKFSNSFLKTFGVLNGAPKAQFYFYQRRVNLDPQMIVIAPYLITLSKKIKIDQGKLDYIRINFHGKLLKSLEGTKLMFETENYRMQCERYLRKKIINQEF